MTKAEDVLLMLCPDVEWTIYGQSFEDIVWNSGTAAITKKQFTDGFAQYDAWKSEQDAVQAQAKSALLEKLGITEDEAKLLLS
jgi:hypothetical protein